MMHARSMAYMRNVNRQARPRYKGVMPNKRFHLTQEEGALARKSQENLKAHPMGLREAIRIVCDAHTSDADGPRGFALVGIPPDFVKVDGDLYWEAWRVLRQYAAG